jgi:hypothetical protein
MKANFYTLIALLTFLSLSLRSSAQFIPDTARMAVGMDVGLPVASISGRYALSLGGSIRFDYPISKHGYVTAGVGYDVFLLGDGALTTQQAILNVPIQPLQTMAFKLGYKYYFLKSLYIQGEAGQTLLVNKNAVYATSSYAFTFAPQIGALIKMKRSHNYVDAGVRYEGVSSFYNDTDKYNFWALHISYSFDL